LHGGQGSREEGEGAGERDVHERLPEFFGLCHLKSGVKAMEFEENTNRETQGADQRAGMAMGGNFKSPDESLSAHH